LIRQPRRQHFGHVDRTGDKHHEFIAAVAGNDVLIPRPAQEQRADVTENAVAREMSIRVVDLLESIEIEENETDLGALSKKALRFREEVSPIENAGELIARGQPVQLANRGVEPALTLH